MAFTSLTFLFLFLPLALLVNHFLPADKLRLRTAVLIVLSLLFYAWGDIKSLPVLLLSVVFNYATGVLLTSLGQERRGKGGYRLFVILSGCLVNVGALALFKYTSLALPVGVSFYTFSALSYLFDIYRGKTECADFLTDACYITFFPKLVSGPIVQYKEMREQLLTRKRNRTDFLMGTHLFLIGMFKKVLLADNLGVAFNQIQGLSRMSAGTAWLGMIYYGLQLYFDFSGYSDMAIGLARMFGFKLDLNFYYPYTSESISEFWRRWHISLGAWFREYVYIPLGGNRCSVPKQVRNLTAVWLLTGIWHGNTWNFVFWGLYHGAFAMLERFALRSFLERIPRPVRVFCTNLIVFIGWVFFFSPSLGSSFAYLGKMFGADGVGIIDGSSLYYLMNNLILLIAAIIGTMPLVDNFYENLVYKQGRGKWAAVAVHGLLMVFCVAFMVGSTYQTFMYFKF